MKPLVHFFPFIDHIRVIGKYETSSTTPKKTLNKRLLLLIIGLIIMVDVNAKKIDGIIVFNNDSVAYVTFDIPVTFFLREVYFVNIQNKIKYYNSANEITKLKPGQAKEIRFEYKNVDVKMLSCVDCGFRDPVFIRIIIDGKLKLYQWYYVPEKVMLSTYYLQKGDSKLFYPAYTQNKKKFDNEMKDYLSDCPELVKKFDGKTYKYADGEIVASSFIDIVKEYNNCK